MRSEESRGSEDRWMAGVETDAREREGVMKETRPAFGEGDVERWQGWGGSGTLGNAELGGEMGVGEVAGDRSNDGKGVVE